MILNMFIRTTFGGWGSLGVDYISVKFMIICDFWCKHESLKNKRCLMPGQIEYRSFVRYDIDTHTGTKHSLSHKGFGKWLSNSFQSVSSLLLWLMPYALHQSYPPLKLAKAIGNWCLEMEFPFCGCLFSGINSLLVSGRVFLDWMPFFLLRLTFRTRKG